MRRRICVFSISLALSLCACSSDATNSGWELETGLGDAGTDSADAAAEAGPPDSQIRERVCVDGSPVEGLPPETPRAPAVVEEAGETPRVIWSELVPDTVLGVPGWGVGLAAGRGDEFESGEHVIVQTRHEDPDEPNVVMMWDIDSRDGDKGGGSGYSPDEGRLQIERLPAPLLVPAARTKMQLVGRTSSGDDGSATGGVKLTRQTMTGGEEGRDSLMGCVADYEFGELEVPPPIPVVRGFVATVDGQLLMLSADRVASIDHTRVDPAGDNFLSADFEWELRVDQLWPDAPAGASFEWMKGVAATEVLVAVAVEAAGERTHRVYALDATSPQQARLILAGERVAPEAMAIGEQYLVRLAPRGEDAGRLVLASAGQASATLEVGCRDVVKHRADRFACLQPATDAARAQLVEFDASLEVRATHQLPDDYRFPRLLLAARSDALVLLGLRDNPDERARAEVLFFEDQSWQRVELPRVWDAEDPNVPMMGNATAVMTPAGRMIVLLGPAFYGVQTDDGPLAATSHPRARFGGNHNRGWVQAE